MSDGISVKRISSPIGELILGAGRGGCRLLEFADRSDARRSLAGLPYNLRVSEAEHGLFGRMENELAEYFAGSAGSAGTLTIPLDLRGTPFQVAVWKALLGIPHGETRTYAEIADAVGRPAAVRAVGSAIGRNPVSVLVPCHRVVRTGGGLGGYGGGLWRKEYLLELEGRQAQTHRVPCHAATAASPGAPSRASNAPTASVRSASENSDHVKRSLNGPSRR